LGLSSLSICLALFFVAGCVDQTMRLGNRVLGRSSNQDSPTEDAQTPPTAADDGRVDVESGLDQEARQVASDMEKSGRPAGPGAFADPPGTMPNPPAIEPGPAVPAHEYPRVDRMQVPASGPGWQPVTPQPGSPTVGPGGGQPSIRLSTGVALAQTLPTGSAMGFSVEYQFVQGVPNRSARYVWVIKSPHGNLAELPMPIANQGTLQTFVTHWRPNPGTYETYIDECHGSARRTVSKKLSMVYSYP